MTSMIETVVRGVVTKGIETLAEFNRRRLPVPEGGNPFLNGIHAPMKEERTLFELSVTGAIPSSLDGRYLRIGPNPIDPDPASYHWFTGDGMVHGLAIENGKAVWYRNRWIRSNEVAKELDVEPAPGPRHIFDTVNTNVVGIGGRTFALVEAGSYPVELGETLDEQVYNPFDGTLKGSFAAHPHRDPKTGEHHAICYDAHDQTAIRHVVIDAAGRVIREEPIAVRHGPMIHDCAITDRFVIILDLPVTFSMKTLIGGHSFPYQWNPAHEARVGLMPRHGRQLGTQADIIWCPVKPGYAFHVANAYDTQDGNVVLDLCVYETMFDHNTQGPSSRSRGFERWTIDPQRRSVDIRTIDGAAQEFPRPDERFFGQPYRYAWTIALPSDPDDRFVGATALYAYDVGQGPEKVRKQVHDFGPGRHPGEFVFVPETPDSEEGAGWLIGFVVDMNTDTTDLAILDTRRFEEAPVASIHLPHRIPPGFHGNWIEA
jgi:carotenoid cleavage dioxygenase-like enzyme